MTAANGSPAVAMRGVSKAFGGRQILDALDMTVERGTNFVIMGPSGTGKSVTLRILSGLLAPDSGEVEVEGIRVDGARPRALRSVRERMGFVFQGAALIAWLSARENVALPLRERGMSDAEVNALVDARLGEVGLSDIGDKLPSQLSGGMRKRVGFARALVLEPSLILYDEPTSGLDPETTQTIDGLITGARDNHGATGIIVSHDVSSTLRIADRIGLLHKGRLDLIVTPEEFRTGEHPLVRRFLDTVPTRLFGRSS